MKLFHKTNLTVLLKSDLHLVRRRIRANEEEDTYMCLVQVLDRSEEAMRAVCRIYWKDYECFHYNRPPVCAGN